MDYSTSTVPAHSLGAEGNVAGRSPRPAPLQTLYAAFYRQRYPVLGAILLALALGVLVTMAMPREYTAVASVRLEQQAPQVIAVPDLDPQRNAQDADRFLQTQMDLVQSRSVARPVADQLKASTNPAIVEALAVRKGNPAEIEEAVVAALIAGVQVELGLNTRLAVISFTSRDPEVSANVANAYARQLMAVNLSSKTDTSSRAADYLKGQLGEAKAQLEDSERRMLGYARAAGLTDTEEPNAANGQGTASLGAQLLGHHSKSMAEATARRIVAEQEFRQFQGVSAMALPQVQENGTIQELIAQRAKFAATKAEENERYTGEYPSDTSAQIGSLDTQIQSVAANIKRTYADNYQSALKQEQEIKGTIDGLRSAAMTERERNVGYNSLEREVVTNRVFYDGLLQRYKGVVAAAGAPSVNVTMVDQAIPPLDPSSPNMRRNMGLALILGLTAAMAIGLVRERMQNVIRSTLDLDEADNLAFLGIIPVSGKGKRMEDAFDNPNSPQSEAYNSVAVSVQKMDSGQMPKTLLVTSSAVGEGKSTTAVGIARSLARLGKRVLLVDGDLRRPSLKAMLDQPDGPGFSEALAGIEIKPQSIIRHIAEQGFDFVSAGNARDNPIGLLAQQNVVPVLAQLAGGYDIAIVDGPPIMGLADAIILSDSVDAIAVIIEANRMESGQLGLALSRLPESKPVGGVLTKFNAKTAGAGYGGEPYFSYA